MALPFSGGRISNEMSVLPLALLIYSVTFMLKNVARKYSTLTKYKRQRLHMQLSVSGLTFTESFRLSITIHTSELVKRYGQRTVVNHVSIEVKQGEIVG